MTFNLSLSLSLSSLSFFLPLHPHVHAPLSKRREADFAHVQRRPPTGADTMRTGIYATTRANIKANLFRTRTREGGGDERVYPLARCRIPFLFFSLSLSFSFRPLHRQSATRQRNL